MGCRATGPLLPEGEHLLLGVVEEGGGARPAAVVKVCYHADLAPDAHINTFYINNTNIITSTAKNVIGAMGHQVLLFRLR